MTDGANTFINRINEGVMAASATPMRSDGRIDPGVVRGYAERLSGSGIAGFAVWAHTGRGLHLSDVDRASVLTCFREVTHLPLVAGAGVPVDRRDVPLDVQVQETVEMARRAESLGADAIMVYPCPGLAEDPQPDRRIVELHAAVADAVALPLLGFHLHAEGGGHPYTIATVRDLLAVPRVVGVKVATLDDAIGCQDVIAEILAAGRLAITGEDRMFGPSLMWGARAALVGIAAAAAPLSVRLLDTWFRGEAAEFLRAAARIDALAAATFHAPIEGYVQRMLWVAAWEGLIPPEHAHDPYGPAPMAAEHERVQRVLERVGVEAGRCEPA